MRPVLIADDSALVRRVLSAQLAAAGFKVLERDSAASATALDGEAPGCAILDLELGDGNGVDVARTLRARDASIAVAFFSGGAPADLSTRAQEVGPVFRKPDQVPEVVAWVRRTMVLDEAP